MLRTRIGIAVVLTGLFSGGPSSAGDGARDPLAVAAAVDREVEKRLADANLPASPLADDAEFLRRVTLDIAGHIPTLDQTIAFLDSNDPDKRRKLIDNLLASKDYAVNFGTKWRNLLAPPGNAVKGKAPQDRFSPWLIEQFGRNQSWDKIVAEVLTVEGDIAKVPQTAFLMANSESFRPQANLLTASTARFFLGVRLGCAECHDHPFTSWKQTDFWGMAAFFGRLRNTSFKGPPFVLTEDPATDAPPKDLTITIIRTAPGGGIVLPVASGKASGKTVQARQLGGAEAKLDDDKPFRPVFTSWLTAKENPYFAPAFVNRTWSHFFGRGFVYPVDDFRDNNPPTHPELLKILADEFRAADYDCKHVIRCICNSKAYQRTSRALPANERDRELYSHMAVKVMSAEAFYDSLTLLSAVGKNGPGKPNAGKPGVDKPNTGKPGTDKPNLSKPGADKPSASDKPNAIDKPNSGKPGTDKPSTSDKPNAVDKPNSGKPMTSQSDMREEFLQLFRAQGESDNENLFRQGIPQFLKRLNGETFNQESPLIDRLLRTGAKREQMVESLYLAVLSRRPSTEEIALMTSYLDRRTDLEKGYAGVLWILLCSGEFALNH